jgi:fructoselysine/glucoselysine PTS system EIIB component
MISSIRIDDRLIHGQVALVWTKEYNTTRIVVANDSASKNDVVKSTLKMAVPSGIKLLVKSVKDSIEIFNDPRCENVNLFVLVNCVHDALEIVKNCKVESVNVANVGRFGDPNIKKVNITPSVLLDINELNDLEELIKLGATEVFSQVIPTNVKISSDKLLAKVNKGKEEF